jgi:hypothetical protein
VVLGTMASFLEDAGVIRYTREYKALFVRTMLPIQTIKTLIKSVSIEVNALSQAS